MSIRVGDETVVFEAPAREIRKRIPINPGAREWELVALTTYVGQLASTVARLSMLFIALSEYYLRNGNASKHPGANS
jgi:hypothetical protein